MNPQQVIDLFVEQGVFSREQAPDLLEDVVNTGKSVDEALVDFGYLTQEQFYRVLADSLGVDFVDLTGFEPPVNLLRAIPVGQARAHGALPVGMNSSAVTVALVDPLNPQTTEDLRFSLGKDIYLVVAVKSQVEDLIQKNYDDRPFKQAFAGQNV